MPVIYINIDKQWNEMVDKFGKRILELIEEIYKTPLWFWAE